MRPLPELGLDLVEVADGGAKKRHVFWLSAEQSAALEEEARRQHEARKRRGMKSRVSTEQVVRDALIAAGVIPG